MKNIPRKSAVNPAPARMICCRDARPSRTALPPLPARRYSARRSRVWPWAIAAVAALAATAPLLSSSF